MPVKYVFFTDVWQVHGRTIRDALKTLSLPADYKLSIVEKVDSGSVSIAAIRVSDGAIIDERTATSATDAIEVAKDIAKGLF
jgi:hypothetical protein